MLLPIPPEVTKRIHPPRHTPLHPSFALKKPNSESNIPIRFLPYPNLSYHNPPPPAIPYRPIPPSQNCDTALNIKKGSLVKNVKYAVKQPPCPPHNPSGHSQSQYPQSSSSRSSLNLRRRLLRLRAILSIRQKTSTSIRARTPRRLCLPLRRSASG